MTMNNEESNKTQWSRFQKYCRYRLSAIDSGNNLVSKCTRASLGGSTDAIITICSYDVCPFKGAGI